MIQYKCRICGVEFDEPYFTEERNYTGDGFVERLRMAHCPICGEGHFDELRDLARNIC